MSRSTVVKRNLAKSAASDQRLAETGEKAVQALQQAAAAARAQQQLQRRPLIDGSAKSLIGAVAGITLAVNLGAQLLMLWL